MMTFHWGLFELKYKYNDKTSSNVEERENILKAESGKFESIISKVESLHNLGKFLYFHISSYLILTSFYIHYNKFDPFPVNIYASILLGFFFCELPDTSFSVFCD